VECIYTPFLHLMDELFRKFAEDDLLTADSEDLDVEEHGSPQEHVVSPSNAQSVQSSTNNNATHSTSNIVHLNVGGRIYSTTLITLQYDPSSMLARMFTGLIPTTKDEQGRYFIDRDGKHFRYILNYLRDGSVKVPQDSVEEVLQEARFYGLDELAINLEERIPPAPTLQEEVRKIKRAVKEADERFRAENDAAIKKLTKYLFSQTESILKQHGSAATVDITINNNFFAPSLYRAAANERARQIAIEDMKKEGLNFTVQESVFSSGVREWKFKLSKDSDVISSP